MSEIPSTAPPPFPPSPPSPPRHFDDFDDDDFYFYFVDVDVDFVDDEEYVANREILDKFVQ